MNVRPVRGAREALYALRIGRHVTPPTAPAFHALSLGVGAATVLLMVVALYLAFAMLVNPAAGRNVLPTGGPLFTPKAPRSGA